MTILFILIMPLLLALVPLFIVQTKPLGAVTAVGYLLSMIASFKLVFMPTFPQSLFGLIYLDALSLFFLLLITLISFVTALYAIGFIDHEVMSRTVSVKKARFYYGLFNLLIFAMLLVPVVNNLGIMWVAIEMTTLISTFLVGFYNTKESVEAAWKYIIICSVGIILALVGTILFSYTLLFTTGLKSLNWTDLVAAASRLDANTVKIAFLFILVGYGTKAGLAPLHTWLPDAHSQAVAPISALLSGVLLKISLYAILRFTLIVNHYVGSVYTGKLFLLFGLLSLGLAAGFILVQKDLKRLLAYSSIEHVGVIVIGFGIGGPLGWFGALWHIFNHAMTKSLMFFAAGNIVQRYKSHNLHLIKGVIHAMPYTGVMALLGLMALVGLPPFSIFFSEMLILIAAFLKGSYLIAFLMLLFLAIAFGGLIHLLSQMIFGKKPKNLAVIHEPWPGAMAFACLLFLICLFGFALPGPLNQLILAAVVLLRGV